MDVAHGETRRRGDADEDAGGRVNHRRRRRPPPRIQRLVGGAIRDASGGRRHRSIRRRRAGGAGLVAKTCREKRGQGVDRRLGVTAASVELDAIAVVHLEPEQADHALGVGRGVSPPDPDIGGEFLRGARQNRRRTGVETSGVAHDHGAGRRLDARRRRCRRRATARADIDLEDHVAAGDDTAAGRMQCADPVGRRDDDLRQQAAGVRGDEVGVELDQRLAGDDLFAVHDAWMESLPFEIHRVEADVHQHLDALGRGEGQRVAGRMQLHDRAGARRAQYAARGIHGHAVADHLLSEDRIGDRLERNDQPVQRREKTKPRGI